jgi:hypothetical protein
MAEPQIMSTDPEWITYDNGVRVPRGQVPMLDQEAASFESRAPTAFGQGGFGAAIGVSPAQPAAPGPVQSLPPQPQYGGMSEFVGIESGGVSRMVSPQLTAESLAPISGGPAPISRGQLTPQQEALLRETETRVTGSRMTPGPSFGAPGQAPAAGQAPGLIVGRRGGGGGGRQLRETATTRQTIQGRASPGTVAAIEEATAAADVEGRLAEEAQREEAVQAIERSRSIAKESEIADQAAIIQERERQGRAQDAQRRIAEAEQEIADTNVQPFTDRSTGSKIVAALAIGLGQFGSALTGGPNAALEVVNEQIDRDIALQREALGRRADRVAGMRTAYGVMLDRFGDERTAEAATRAVMLGKAEQDAARMAAVAQDEVSRRQLETARAELQAEGARQRAAAEIAAQPTTEIVSERRRGFGGGGRGRQVLIDPATGVELTTAQAIELGLVRGPGAAGGDLSEEEQKQLERYAGRRGELAAASRGLREVAAAGEGGDLAGLGLVQGAGREVLSRVAGAEAGETIANLLTSERGLRNRAAIGDAVDRYVQAITGATATPEQRANAMSQFGLGPGSSERDVRAGMRTMLARVQEAERSAAAGVTPAVERRYQQRAGASDLTRARGEREIE